MDIITPVSFLTRTLFKRPCLLTTKLPMNEWLSGHFYEEFLILCYIIFKLTKYSENFLVMYLYINKFRNQLKFDHMYFFGHSWFFSPIFNFFIKLIAPIASCVDTNKYRKCYKVHDNLCPLCFRMSFLFFLIINCIYP